MFPVGPARVVNRVAAASTVLWMMACPGDATRSDGRGGPVVADSTAPVAVIAVQLGSFADESAARALADSLSAAGWLTSIREAAVGGRTMWRVQIAPTTSDELTQRIAAAFRAAGRNSLVVRDSARRTLDVEVFPVNRGTHGMSARTRWTQSPDRSAIIVVEDPVAVEAEALPNGFLFATERGPVLLQRDSVWDVSPSPDWTRLAYGRAWVLNAGEAERVPDQLWARLAAEVQLPIDSVRRGAFMSSGMVPAYGFAQPVVVDVSSTAPGTSMPGTQIARTLPIAGGWRVRWTPEGRELVIGANPEMVQDDTPPPTWFRVDPTTGGPLGPIAESALAPVGWRDGPVIDISVLVDLGPTRSLAIDGGTLESRNGWIRMNDRIIGPGMLLAATRTGRFIAAMAPRHDAKQYEAPIEPVVYQVGTGGR